VQGEILFYLQVLLDYFLTYILIFSEKKIVFLVNLFSVCITFLRFNSCCFINPLQSLGMHSSCLEVGSYLLVDYKSFYKFIK
jgi:hypothetical protein